MLTRHLIVSLISDTDARFQSELEDAVCRRGAETACSWHAFEEAVGVCALLSSVRRAAVHVVPLDVAVAVG